MPVKKLSEPMKYQRRRQFTLVEIMVVIVIISVILGITVPVFNSIATRSSVDAAASMIADSLRLARATAAQKRTMVTLVLPAADKGAAYEMRWKNPASDADEVLPDTKKEFLPVGALVEMGSDDLKITFKANGTLETGSTSQIKIYEAVLDAGKNVQDLHTENKSFVHANLYTGMISVSSKGKEKPKNPAP